MEKLINSREAASFLGLSEDKFKELVGHRLIPAYLIAGEFLRFKEDELEVIKGMLKDRTDFKDERVINRAFSEVKGLERAKEIWRANDLYLLAIIIILIILGFMYFR